MCPFFSFSMCVGMYFHIIFFTWQGRRPGLFCNTGLQPGEKKNYDRYMSAIGTACLLQMYRACLPDRQAYGSLPYRVGFSCNGLKPVVLILNRGYASSTHSTKKEATLKTPRDNG
jgi:hypothetical protein